MKPFKKIKNVATIYHGNALDVLPLLKDAGALAVITDPPYSSGGTFRGDRARPTREKYLNEKNSKHPEFSGDNMDQRTYLMWSCEWLRKSFEVLPDGGFLLCFTDWRQLPTLTDAVQMSGFVWKGVLVWDKTEGCRPQIGCFRSQCEYVIIASKGAYKPQVTKCPSGVVREHCHAAEKQHVAQKPVEVMEHLLQILPEGALVIDPFMGSGSTGVAAVKNKMNFIGIEMDEHFCNVANERISQLTRN